MCTSTALSTAIFDFDFYKNTEIQRGNELTLNPCLRNPRTKQTPTSLKYCPNPSPCCRCAEREEEEERKKEEEEEERKKEEEEEERKKEEKSQSRLKEEEDRKGGGRQFGAGGRGRIV